MTNYITTDTELTSVADAIRARGGTTAQLAFPSGFVSAVQAIPADIVPTGTKQITITQNGTTTEDVANYASAEITVDVQGGGGITPVPAKDVNFRDYDGTIVYSYSSAEFAALSSMPANPSHSGLTAQGWNWTLTDAQAHVAEYGKLEIGQMYITDDGKTRLYIHLGENTPSNRMKFFVCFSSSVANNTIVDWGDGTVETKGTTTPMSNAHTYATTGDFIITLTVTTGTITLGGSSSNDPTPIYGTYQGDNYYNHARIYKVEIGSGVASIYYAFRLCKSLTSVTIPNSVTNIEYYAFGSTSLTFVTIPNSITSIGTQTFSGCHLTSIAIPNSVTSIQYGALSSNYFTSITIPNSVTSILGSAFQYCYGILTSITIPNSVTSIENYTFSFCQYFTSVTIPNNITSIGTNVFSGCYTMGEYHLLPTTPPTLSNKNAFSAIAADCIIYVPYSVDHSILNAYQTATNWSTYASYMQEEPQ